MNDLKKQYIKQTEEKNKRRERGGIYKEFPTDLWKDTHTRLKTMDWIENKSLDKSFNEKVTELLQGVQKVLEGLCCPGSRYRREAWKGTAPQLSENTHKYRECTLSVFRQYMII